MHILKYLTKKKHICPNRLNNTNKKSVTPTTNANNISTYYKKSFATNQQSKPKMSNSLKLFHDPSDSIKMKYEVLSDIVMEYNDKVMVHNPTLL
jgi:hypothetical protein